MWISAAALAQELPEAVLWARDARALPGILQLQAGIASTKFVPVAVLFADAYDEASVKAAFHAKGMALARAGFVVVAQILGKPVVR